MKPPPLALELLQAHRARAQPANLPLTNTMTTSSSEQQQQPVPLGDIIARIYDLKRCYATLLQTLATGEERTLQQQKRTSQQHLSDDGDDTVSSDSSDKLEGDERPRRRRRTEPTRSGPSSSPNGANATSTERRQEEETLGSIVADIQSGIRSKLSQCIRGELVMELQREAEERAKIVKRMAAALDVAKNLA